MDPLKFVSFVYCLILMKSGLISCETQSFTIAFMANAGGKCPTSQELLLFISASEIANCSISAPGATPLFSTTVLTGDANDVVEVNIPTTLKLSGSGIAQKGISVSCNTTVTVYGINACSSCTDGFSVIPNSQLGNEYFAFTVQPSSTSYYTQVAVVSYLDNTVVNVCVPFCVDCQVFINSNMYGPGSCINQALDAYEALQIQSKGNLAGTYISSNNPVAVFSGNDKTAVNGANTGHLVIQVPPLKLWGKQFVAVRSWNEGLPVFIMAGTTDTSVNITCTITTSTLNVVVRAGDIYKKSLSADDFCFIETNHPVFVVQIMGDTDPSLMPLIPIDQYCTSYLFRPSRTSNFVQYFIFVIEEAAVSGLMLDDEAIQINSVQIPGTTLIGGYFQITDNQHHVTHPYATFNGILLGSASSESYALSLGRNWNVNTIVATTDEKSSLAQFTYNQISTILQSTDLSTPAVTPSTVSPDKGSTLTSSNTAIQGSRACTHDLQGAYFVDMTHGYDGYEIIAEHVMQSIIQCALWCRRQDLCTSFQYNTQTGSCLLLRVGENTLDSLNGQIFTLEC